MTTEWIEWHGGEQPVADDVVVEVKLRDDEPKNAGKGLAKEWSWLSLECDADIIAYRVIESAPAEHEIEPVAWILTDEHINELQVASISKVIERCKHAHFTNLKIRINGGWEEYETDWIKYIKPVSRPASPCQRCKELEAMQETSTEMLQSACLKDAVRGKQLAALEAEKDKLDAECDALADRIDTLESENARLTEELTRIRNIAACGTVDSWMSLSDDFKRKWFAMTLHSDAEKSKTIKEQEYQLEQQADQLAAATHAAMCWKMTKEWFGDDTIRRVEASADIAIIAAHKEGK